MSIVIIFYNNFKYLYYGNYLLLKDKYANNDEKERSINAKSWWDNAICHGIENNIDNTPRDICKKTIISTIKDSLNKSLFFLKRKILIIANRNIK